MLKESKKLQRVIESLTKKNVTLQKKLDEFTELSAPVSAPTAAGSSKVTITPSLVAQSAAIPFPSIYVAPTTAHPHVDAPQRTFTPMAPTPPPKDVNTTNSNVFTPPQPRTPKETPAQSRLHPATEIQTAESSSAGKKRRAPDDFYPSEPLPAQPIIVDAAVTPRPRKPLRTLKTGFTPVRGLASSARPTLGQPSPIRRSGTLAAERTITDVTNATFNSKRTGAAQASGGWLGKIRNGSSKRIAQHDDSG